MRFLIEQTQVWEVEADDIEQANAIMQGTPPDTLDVHVQKLHEREECLDEDGYDEGEEKKDPGFGVDIEWPAGVSRDSLLRQQAISQLMNERDPRTGRLMEPGEELRGMTD